MAFFLCKAAPSLQDFAAHMILAVFTIPMYWCYWQSWKADPKP